MSLWRWFLAWTRLDLRVVCEESTVDHDYHAIPDDDGPAYQAEQGLPMRCRRCGKRFYLRR
jgi:hypothetical protein